MGSKEVPKSLIHAPKEDQKQEVPATGNVRVDENISETMPDGKWHFNEDCTKAFDNMLERSIPDYFNMRQLCHKIGRRFVKPGEQILDLGCSKGEALAPFVLEFGSSNHYLGIEVSPPMLEVARDRFRDAAYVEIINLDLRNEFPQGSNCLVLSVLTLQFIPINYRQRILRQIYDHLSKDSALILVEKVLGNTAIIDDLLVETYHEQKMDNGYSMNEVERKKLALEGVLVPLTAQINEQFLHNAGFVQVDAFWRNLNFCAWVAVR